MNSDDAEYMWSDSEDLAIIADMYQMKIKIITTKGMHDDQPTVNWIYPDPRMAEFAELKDVEIDDMVLLHENDLHFNLVVAGDSDLATQGSLSYRFNIGPTVAQIEEKVVDSEEEKEDDEEHTEDIELFKRQLKKCELGKRNLEIEYKKCEKELRNQIEENVKLKIENKDLKEIAKLSKQLEEKENEDVEVEVAKDMQEEEEYIWKMKNSGSRRKGPQVEAAPVKLAKKYKVKTSLEEEFNCAECFFQGTNKVELERHFDLKHTRRENIEENAITCKNCGDKFKTRMNLMYHRKSKHLNTVAYCRNKREGKCDFSDDKCWWNHQERCENTIECFICNQTFETKTRMMVHRRNEHKTVVKYCNKFQQGNCRYRDERKVTKKKQNPPYRNKKEKRKYKTS